MSHEPVVAIAGVTGAVGAEFIATMDRRAFPVRKLKALASARSAGKTIDFRGERIVIEELTEKSFEGVDIALFSAGGGISRKFSPAAVKAGAVVIDNSSAFRMDPNVPLVIPEINAGRIREHKGIIAIPNCSAITALVPLWPIHGKTASSASSCRPIRRRAAPAPPRWKSWWNRPALISTAAPFHAQGDPAPLRLQPLQPQHGD